MGRRQNLVKDIHMATAARKARKRAGIKFNKPAKVGTPLEDRSYFTEPVPGAMGTKFAGSLRPRSKKKQEAMRKARFVTS
jgi:hypothetical protein